MDESEVREQERHDRRMAREKAAREHLAAIEMDAARYRWLRVRGCAIDGTEHQREGLVRRCINLDEQVDALRNATESRKTE